VVPHERALERGIEIAHTLPRSLRSTGRCKSNLNLHRRLVQDVPFGMALEGLTAADLAYQDGADSCGHSGLR